MKRLFWIHDAVTRLTFWAAAAGVLYLTLVTAGEVFGRYALSRPSDWAPDTAAVSFALITFLAVPWLTWQGGHAAMTFLVDAAPGGLSAWMRRLNYLVGAVVCGACAWIGGVETARQISSGVMIVAVTPIPKWVVFVPLTYALGSSALYFARHFAASFSRGDTGADAGKGEGKGEGAWTGT